MRLFLWNGIKVSNCCIRTKRDRRSKVRTRLNSILRGWQNYFSYGTVARMYASLKSPRLRSCSPSLLATGSSEELLELLPRCTLLLPLGTPLHLGELLSRQEWPFSWIVRFLRFRNVHALSQEGRETSCAIFSRLCGPGQNTVSTSDTKWDRAAARHPASSICRARRALLHAAGEQEDCRLRYPIGQSSE
jgi:hypothetical protein